MVLFTFAGHRRLARLFMVEALGSAPPAPANGKGVVSQPLYGLRQVPDVGGGFMAMDPKTGRVFALIGGWVGWEFLAPWLVNRMGGMSISHPDALAAVARS